MLSSLRLRFLHHRLIRVSGIFLSLLVTGGCALQPGAPGLSAPARERAWQKHQQQVTQLTTWQIAGRASLSGLDYSGTATINWEQHPACFTLQATTFMGQTLARFQGWQPPGHPERALLRVPGRPPVSSLSADLLLRQQTGLDVPMETLAHWIKGIPAPGPHRTQLDKKGRLHTLDQQGWHLVYEQYSSASLALPIRIRAHSSHMKLTISVREWDLSAKPVCPGVV
ncbi:MAG: lipoprotein insertase outer membrane protein LolB [Kistimonas sp.]|nr:lipoprotein insertase outer membrane protein LolB [Kistimonas sp.]